MCKPVGFPEPTLHAPLLSGVTFEEVSADTMNLCDINVLDITRPGNDQAGELEAKIRRELTWCCWWLQQYWCGKESPSEQYVLETDRDIRLGVYNYGDSLEQRHLDELAGVVKLYAPIRGGAVLRAINYIVIDNLDYPNPQTGEPTNGQFRQMERSIVMFPSGLTFEPHRVAKTSNFTGTLIHELSHGIGVDFLRKWIEKFKWHLRTQAGRLPGGMADENYCEEPERCVTDYARFNPGDDICESVVAALTDPGCLDAERMQFLMSNAFNQQSGALTVSIQKMSIIQMPSLQGRVRYRLWESRTKAI